MPDRGHPYSGAGAAGTDGTDPLTRAGFSRDDLGNGRRLMAVHGDDIAHIDKSGFTVWQGEVWDADNGDKRAMQMALRLPEIVMEEMEAVARQPVEKWKIDATMTAEQCDEKTAIRKIRAAERGAWRGHIARCGKLSNVKNALDVLKFYAMNGKGEFDNETLRITLGNGTLDLSRLPSAVEIDVTPEEIAAAFVPEFFRGDMSTHQAPVDFDPHAECPRWLAFIELIMPSPAMRHYLRMVFGYCLSGSVSEQCIFLFQGEGKNGKSVLMTVMARLLGDYSTVTPIETFLRDKNRSGASASPDVARLDGRRLVRASEPRKGDVLDDGRLKEFSGGELMATRELYGKYYEFQPRAKLFLSFNRVPSIYSDDDGMWRRIHLIPFSVQIPESMRRAFEVVVAELMAEAPGILNWMIAGWRDYVAAGRIERPEEVEIASQDLRETLDTIGQFLAECCIKGNDERAQFAHVYLVYEKWAARLGDKPISRKALAMALENKGYKKDRGGGNNSAYRGGLRLRWRDEVGPDIGRELYAEWLRHAGAPVDRPMEDAGDF